MNLKPLLLAAACSTLFVSQFTLAIGGLGTSVVSKKEAYKTNFNYTNAQCKKWGYDAGVIKIGSQKYCAKTSEAAVSNMKAASSKTWSKTSSKTDWLFCDKDAGSCSQSLATGKNSCVSASSSITKASL